MNTTEAALHDHWQRVFTNRPETEVSWYQPHLRRSLNLILTAAPDRSTPIIDIGGGASTLAEDLLGTGYTDVTVLDISEAALTCVQARMGIGAGEIHLIAADVTTWSPARRFGVWHDRAAFHFLVEPERQAAYVATLLAATAPGAAIIIATFALDGPEKCSGLPVQRYSPETLAARLGPDFAPVLAQPEEHRTPAGALQRFSWAVLRRK
jgi:hypothetical protein